MKSVEVISVMEKCANCRYFKYKTAKERDNAHSSFESTQGLCRRYPDNMIKDKSNWCGEWR